MLLESARKALGSEHSDLCQLTDAQKSSNSCEDLHDDFHAIPDGKKYPYNYV